MSQRVVIVGQYMEGIEIERRVLEPIGAEIIDTRDFSEAEIDTALRSADAVLFRKLGVTRELISTLEQCKIICTYAAGYDAIDVEAATDHHIMVANTPGYGNDEVADHTLMLLFALTRRLIPQVDTLRAAASDGDVRAAWTHRPYMPIHRIRGQTLGIIGLGRIGKTVAWKAQGLGLKVIATDPYVSEEIAAGLGVPLLPLDDLLRTSDYVTLHTPLTAETLKIISPRELSLMKPSAYLINCARGKVVDHASLVAALRQNEIAGAALDVVEIEPLPPNMLRELLAFPNVIVTPHNAWYSDNSVDDRQRIAAETVRDALLGQVPEAVVNRAAFL
ncbi:MAG TPA: C-terminal binding protein [Nitrolancea sp.]|jgi:D-3-phosphoglycerate dehydrogenase|nr:C-terminal binding protein [Nitrolancea sp.]